MLSFAQVPIDSISNSINLDAVEITVKDSPLGTSKNQEYSLKMNAIERLPQFMGSTDPLRTFQLLPGVQTMGEGSGGLYVEGCSPFHNLILLDAAPVYNPIHLGGFFSVFNSDHLGEFVLRKNYISSEYGSCLAAVLTANTKTKIPEKTKFDANVSLLVSSATLEVPLNKHSKISFSGRMSYLTPTLNLINSLISQKSDIFYSFYDINSTYYFSNSKHEVKASLYAGNDKVNIYQKSFAVDGDIVWSNLTGALSWKYIIDKKSSFSQNFYYSSFNDDLTVSLASSSISLLSDIKKIGYKNRYNFKYTKFDFLIGTEIIKHIFVPQHIVYKDSLVSDKKNYPIEISLFGDVQYEINSNLSANLGLRLSSFYYQDSLCLTNYFINPEPRLNLRYKFTKSFYVDLSMQQQVQYVNQVMTSSIGFPSNFWIMSSDNVPYQQSQSCILACNKSFKGNNYELISNLFYRKLQNQFESSGYLTDLMSGSKPELSRFYTGDGDNYGCELLFKKNSNKLTGWLSYTLSWAWREFDQIEQAKRVPAISDRRHVLNLVANYALSSKWDFACCFVLASGVPSTFSKGIYLIGEMAVNEYPAYNSNRLPSYHRLDLSITRSLKIKYFRTSKLNFSVYNVYGRLNPYLFSTALLIDEENARVKIQRNRHSLYSILSSIGLKIGF